VKAPQDPDTPSRRVGDNINDGKHSPCLTLPIACAGKAQSKDYLP